MRRDPLIIGAGPAGTAAAITLARAGCCPIMIERASGPTDKVCGDFLSIDAIRRAQALGVDPASLGAAPIRYVRLIHRERVAQAALPFPAMGLSRRGFDAALLRHAQSVGAILRGGQTVRQLAREVAPPAAAPSANAALARVPLATSRLATTFPATAPVAGAPEAFAVLRAGRLDPAAATCQANAPPAAAPGQWTARTADQTAFSADTVFLATGKHDLRDLPRPRTDRGAVGMKMYFALAPDAARMLGDAIELTLFPGGYAGMQPVENGQAVLCIAIQRQALLRHGGTWATLLVRIQQHSRRFSALLAGARALLARPLAIAGVPYGYRSDALAAPGLFRLGDQAAVIPSLTGDGMAIALHSGASAAEAWLAGADSTAYHRALARTLRRQMRLAGLLHHACMTGSVQAAITQAAALFPALLHQAANRTRLASPQAPSGQPTGA
ncbi:NAD(P)/FAD-dependent oxidoreductase [Rhodopila sp.]|uniref:NAD(P)/FAD-dependent oxidoreductase n=1 Tax=Rhodopila sp. TaxID=2480087 RepID=UPI003D0E2599